MFFVPQILKDDCGMAALKMLLADVHHDKNYLFIPQDEEHGPYSYDDLIDIARTYSVELEGFSVPAMIELEKSDDFPFIATIKTLGGPHAVYVYKRKGRRIYLLDPLDGKVEMSVSKFIELWDGTLLKVKQYVKTRCPYQEAKPISSGQWFVLNLLQILAAAAAIAGVFFISENVYIFLPIALFSLAVILEIAMKSYSFSIMRTVDDFFYDAVIPKEGEYTKTLRRFERYKHGLLTSFSNFIVTFLITLAFIVIILNNDIKNFLLIAGPLLAASLEGLFYRPYLRRGFRNVGYLEEQLDSSVDPIDYRDKVTTLHKEAYKYGRVEMFKRYIGLALYIGIAVVLMAINGMVSFPYVIFYLCIQIMVYQCFKTLLDYPAKCEEMLKEKVEINNCLHQNDENK